MEKKEISDLLFVAALFVDKVDHVDEEDLLLWSSLATDIMRSCKSVIGDEEIDKYLPGVSIIVEKLIAEREQTNIEQIMKQHIMNKNLQ